MKDRVQTIDNIGSILKVRADLQGDKTAFSFIKDLEVESTITYNELFRDAQLIAHEILNKVKVGERVVLCFQNDINFIKAFFGCIYAGVIAVPSYPPKMNRTGDRLKGIIDDCTPSLILSSEASSLDKLLLKLGVTIPVLQVEKCFDKKAQININNNYPIAFLQYTSGSTGTPKGVKISQENLISNQELLSDVFKLTENDVLVGWLPFFHDMGLIGNILNSVYCGYTAYLMPPVSFLKKPAIWLQSISKFKATVSGGPNFAYQLCVDSLSDEEVGELNLSSWKVAFNGAEKIKSSTLKKFSTKFSSVGFDYNAFVPCYGMAETTLIVSGVNRDSNIVIEDFTKEELSYDNLIEDSQVQEHVGCGAIHTDYEFKFIDNNGNELPSGKVGELCLKGRSVTSGYWNSINDTFTEDLYLKTGDLGVVREGQLYITGRKKDIIIINGKNHYPSDFEQFAEKKLDYVVPNGIAAFGIEKNGVEGLVMVIEHFVDASTNYDEIAKILKSQIGKEFEIVVHELILIRKGSGLRTTSGKIQRGASKIAYLSNHFNPLNTQLKSENATDFELENLSLQEKKLVELITKYIGTDPVRNPEKSIFEFGVDSIKVVQLIEAINETLNLKIGADEIYEFDTLDRLLYLVNNPNSYEISIANDQEIVPATPLQKSIWINQEKNPKSTGYNIPIWFDVEQSILDEEISNLLTQFISDNTYLQSCYDFKDGEIISQINKSELSFFEIIEKGMSIEEVITDCSRTKFDLKTGPLFKTFLIKDQGRKVILLLAHHILVDGQSVRNIVQTLQENIKRLGTGKNIKINSSDFTFRDYCKSFNFDRNQQKRDFWLDYLKGFNSKMNLPILSNRSRKGESFLFEISNTQSLAVKNTAEQLKVNQYAVMLSAYFLLLRTLTNDNDLLVGVPVSTRGNEDFEDALGLFLTTGFIRKIIQEDESVLAFIRDVYSSSRAAIRNSSYDLYGDEKLRSKSESVDFSLSNIFFNYLDFSQGEEIFDVYKENPGVDLNFDLNFYCISTENQFKIRIDYKGSNFSKDSIGKVADLFTEALTYITASNVKSLLPNLTTQLIRENKFEANIIHPWVKFEKKVLENPNAVAIIGESKTYSRDDVSLFAKKVSGLIQETGYKGNVGVLIGHNERNIFSQLGILHSGNTFVILDPSYPQQRLNQIIFDAEIGLILHDDEVSINEGFNSSCQIINIESQNENCEFTFINRELTDLAYILYTSGSTGKPKGVMQSLGYISHIASSFGQSIDLKEEDCVSLIPVFSFSASVMDIYGALLTGSSLKIIDIKKGIDNLVDALKEDITIYHSVPTIFREAIKEWQQSSAIKNNIRLIYLAGEKLLSTDIELFNSVFPETTELVNALGCTEYNVCSQNFIDTRISENIQAIDLGFDGLGVEVLIMGDSGNIISDYQEGEIVLKSDWLSLGYWKQEDLTKARFHSLNGESYFKTGDIGVRLPDGRLKSLGRSDYQVKLNGQRIELGEIEDSFQKSFPSVESVVVLMRFVQQNNVLVVYYKSILELDYSTIKEQLSKELPMYMIPSYAVKIEEFNYTKSGKIDRRSLPDPQYTVVEDNEEFLTDIEKKISLIWSSVLGLAATKVKSGSNFFQLGGNSIQAIQVISRMKSQMNLDIKLSDFFSSENFSEIIQQISNDIDTETVCKIDKAELYELTPQQSSIWTLSQISTISQAFNLQGSIRISGVFSATVFKTSLLKVIQKYDILRASFHDIEGSPMMKIEDVGAEVMDTVFSFNEGVVNDEYFTFKDLVFDTTDGFLFRFELSKRGENDYNLSYCFHHIIADGWSSDILIKELFQAYHNNINTPELNQIQFQDYAHWFNSKIINSSSKQYWLTKLQGNLSSINLMGRIRVNEKENRAIEEHFNLGVTSLQKVEELSQKLNCTNFSVVVSLLNLLFYKISGKNDLTIGTDSSGRSRFELENQIGYFLNVLPIRNQFEVDIPVVEFFKQVNRSIIEAFDHQNYPIENVLRDLSKEKEYQVDSLFDILVLYQNFKKSETSQFEGLELTKKRIPNEQTFFDLTLEFHEIKDSLQIFVKYKSSIYTSQIIQNLVKSFQYLVDNIYFQLSDSLKNVEITKTEKLDLGKLRSYESVLTKIKSHCRKSPEKIALKCEGELLTYLDLEIKINKISHKILSQKLNGPHIGVYLRKDEKSIITILSIIKAGGTFVPLDLRHPLGRIKEIVENAKLSMIICDSPRKEIIQKENFDCEILNIDDPIENDLSIELNTLDNHGIAYIMFTSGSTGKPKGVLIKEDSLYNYISAFSDYFNINTSDTVIQQANLTFDTSIEEIFPTLCNGATLHIITEGGIDSLGILEAIKSGASILSATPSLINEFNEHPNIVKKLRILISGGDILREGNISNLIGEIPIYNTYGPTETTVCATFGEVTKKSDLKFIGKVVSGYDIIIVNEDLQEIPKGFFGEICIGGFGVFEGYLDDPQTTMAVIFENKGTNYYKTGDFGAFSDDDKIIFRGRKDDQVKIRGQRIDISEIELALNEFETIEEACVLKRKLNFDEVSLEGYLKINEEFKFDKFINFLKTKLPDFMIPSRFFKVDDFPLTSSGKVDKSLLLKNNSEEFSYTQSFKHPTSDLEKKLVSIWLEILKLDTVSINADFFATGGHSLLLGKVKSRIKTIFDVDIEYKKLYQSNTIEKLALTIKEQSEWALEVSDNEDEFVF